MEAEEKSAPEESESAEMPDTDSDPGVEAFESEMPDTDPEEEIPEAEELAEEAFHEKVEDRVCRLNGIVSRKKQLIPALIEAIHRQNQE